MSDRFGETMQFNSRNADIPDAKSIIMSVYAALKAKGYDPITQIVGYIISGDPTYITSYNNARSMIKRLERDEILEELVRFYVRSNEGKR
ncbi:MAG TPA: IreB family regulatory phosphoprotein [Candidatus Fimadaptatus faecigallinarum]|uniref:UPF0297 protein IAC59_03010 n=1 Tax=Candidatus Fimadaptatus faecigallinarum TaxID=2840814 RepID=A0A9D1LQM7_9FIRM|nr:IreB family regulatory phosphoprotein [Candidatus Fimadaptatus faecigallinarum]